MNRLIRAALADPQMDQDAAARFYELRVAMFPTSTPGDFALRCLLKTFLTYPLQPHIRHAFIDWLNDLTFQIPHMPAEEQPQSVRFRLLRTATILFSENREAHEIFAVLIEALEALRSYVYTDALIASLNQTPPNASCDELRRTITDLYVRYMPI